MVEDQALPVEVSDLQQLLDAIRSGIGAISAMDEQISQMRGMFGDEDGAIEEAVEDGEHASEFLENALAFVESLKNEKDFGVAMLEGAAAEDERRSQEVASQIQALTADFPSAERLLAMRDRLLEGMDVADSTARDEGEDAPEISIGHDDAGTIVELLEGAARSANTPIEVAVHVAGGCVQSMIRPQGDPRPLAAYVHDHDVEGHVEEQDGPLATILFETASGDGPAEKCVLAVHEDVWEVTRPDGPYWTTLRSEARRLGEAG